MKCYVHKEENAVGTCVTCGEFICENCCTKINNKNHCKSCVNEVVSEKSENIDRLNKKIDSNSEKAAPMVFMNAGGGSSSSSSSSSTGDGGPRNAPPYPKSSVGLHVVLLLFTGGLGNIVYYIYVKSKREEWTRRYS